MSGRIVGEVFDNAPADLRPAERLVFLALAEDARDDDRLAKYSDVSTLVRRTCLAPGTVRNALAELARRCLIKPTTGRAHIGRHQVWHLTHLEPHHRETHYE